MDKLALLRNAPIFANLNDDALALLARGLGSQVFERGQTIVRQGSPGSILYIVVTGQVRIYTLSESGQELSLAIYRDGEVFGELSLLDEQPRSASAQAMAHTVALTLPRGSFLRAVHECPAIAVAVMAAMARRMREMNAYAEDLAVHPAPRRVVRKLLSLAVRHGISDAGITRIDLRLTQDDLASLAGTTRETVNRVLSTLRDQGTVQIERARISVLDFTQLERTLSDW